MQCGVVWTGVIIKRILLENRKHRFRYMDNLFITQIIVKHKHSFDYYLFEQVKLRKEYVKVFVENHKHILKYMGLSIYTIHC